MLVFWQLEVCLTAVVHDFFCRYVRIMRVLLFLPSRGVNDHTKALDGVLKEGKNSL